MTTQVRQAKELNQPLIVLSDPHGSAKTLFALLARYPNHRPVILGDMVDRGPDSKSIVEWARDNKVLVTKGNHEDLLVDHYLGTGRYEPGLWRHNNGGNKTIKSWRGRVPQYMVTWMAQLPLCIILPEYPDLLLSHTGHGLGTTEASSYADLLDTDALWGCSLIFPNDGYYRILGHSRVKTAMVTETFALIDTGAAYPGYGILSAMLWPSREIVTQPYID